MIRHILCLGVVFLSLAAGATEDEIRAADQKWAAAVKNGDISTLDRMYTPGLIYAHASGKVDDKATYLGRLKSGKQHYTAVQIESTKAVGYGDSAVSHSVVRTIGTNDSGPFNDHVMMMHVWVKQGGEWHLAAHQTTKLP
jgi:ketosteroid isomerase-like protein